MKIKEIPDGVYSSDTYSISCDNTGEWNLVKYWAVKKKNPAGLPAASYMTRQHLVYLLTENGTDLWKEMPHDVALLASLEDFEFFNIFQPLHDKIAAKYTKDFVPAQAFRKIGTKTYLENGGYYGDFKKAYGYCWEDRVCKLGIPIMEEQREYKYTPKSGKQITRIVKAKWHGHTLGEGGRKIYIEPYSRNDKTRAKTRRAFQYGARDTIPPDIYKKLTPHCDKRIYKIAIGMLVADMTESASQKKVCSYEVKDGLARVVSEYKDKAPRMKVLKTRNLLHHIIIQEQKFKMEELDAKIGMTCANTDGFLTTYDLSEPWVKQKYPNLQYKRFDKAWISDFNNYILEIDGQLRHWGKVATVLRDFPELRDRADSRHKWNGKVILDLRTVEIKDNNREQAATRTRTERRGFWKDKCTEVTITQQIKTIADNSVAGSGKTWRLNELFKEVGVENIYGYTYNVENQDQIRRDNKGAQITGLIKNQNNFERGEFNEQREYAAVDEGQDANYEQLYHILLRIKKGGTLYVFLDPSQAINALSTRGMGIELTWFQEVKHSLISRRISHQLADFIRDKLGITIYGSFDEPFRLEVKDLEDVTIDPSETFVCYHNLTGVTAKDKAKQVVGKANYKDTLFKAKGKTIDDCTVFIDFMKPKEEYVALTRCRKGARIIFSKRAWAQPWVNEAGRAKWQIDA